MQPEQTAEAEMRRTELAAPGPRERPWLFAFLIAPDAVISLGLITGALSYLLRNEGIDPGQAGSIVALLAIPHAIYFAWGPITDFLVSRRTWLIAAATAAATLMLAAFHQSRLGSQAGVTLMFIGACVGQFTVAACGGIMGTLRSETNRRRAGSFYQTGSLAFGALAVFALVALAQKVSLRGLGWILAGMIAAPSLSALLAPANQRGAAARESAAQRWREFKSEFKATFWRVEAIPYTLMMIFPAGSGAMIGLLPGIARDYGVNGAEVAWLNGIGGALLTAAGAMAVSLIPVRVRAPIAYLSVLLVNAATLAVLALGPLHPATYFIGTVLFLFTIGGGYALYTAVALEFMGSSGKSGSSRYAIINSLGNAPVAYMAFVDGRAYAHWGSRGMPGVDAILSALAASLLLAHFAVSTRMRKRRAVQ
jgi:MFS transporter, PAT family, beta-lactamase induction signal transducer AmpG